MDSFDYSQGREFWPEAFTTEIVKERTGKSLLACAGRGHAHSIRLGEVDWTSPQPKGRFLADPDEIDSWLE